MRKNINLKFFLLKTKMTNNLQTSDEMSDNEKAHKIEMLRQMMLQAEKTMQSAKAMLLQLEGKKKTGRKRKIDEDSEGDVVEGTFDGQIMIGTDGKQYPVPANYASKSKLVEGDMLKLTITPDGSFIYKQIGPADRKSVIGIVSQDEKGNYFIFSEGKPYKVLLASVTYFKAEPGDEVVIMLPRDIEATWAAIENVLQKGHDTAMSMSKHMPEKEPNSTPKRKFPADGELNSWKDDLQSTQKETKQELIKDDFVDEWTSDIEELEKEIKAQQI
ncbi:MAG: 50S ribosomal protein L7/L12 [Candidatus Moranbacteria bacterium GW2011_GWE1_36_7]|nr:MAG: 50S ribosomal protein L7/L12 [Candidatus Moranbacteria bacterium GW2011_GWD2_36_12]KKQ06506.1 MAG: 50S ribosomal protein L7/L12 [Candidatus Moranbacteria bacterium GW2011_GWE2_36_40]KKQ15084.1 MAG: 50S ribosomal protein L7/L12 [Candidatus Moranbacteria bacterium GW2011_GWE1_36_7]